ncbi:MAG TPA: EamA family transporter RarD [Longimicrobiaceae bacterium]
MNDGKRGMLFATGAYLAWGLLPVYWKSLQQVPADEILAHRMTWSLGFVAILLAARGHWGWLRSVLGDRRVLLTFTASALLLSANWFLYIWAVNADHVVETSLGYFINPLVNVVLGMVFLRERLRPVQTVALLTAAAGVLYLTVNHGRLPWIALGLAFSFGLYGLLRKTATLSSLEGLALETLVLFLPALLYLLYLELEGRASFAHAGATTSLLLALAGAATAIPLLLFASGARLISMTVLGVLQYIAPTLQFLLGVFVYDEELTTERLIGFCFVWVALLIFAGEGIAHRQAALRSPPYALDNQ